MNSLLQNLLLNVNLLLQSHLLIMNLFFQISCSTWISWLTFSAELEYIVSKSLARHEYVA
jgi:hypothetical protein